MAKIAVVVLSGRDNPGRASAGLHVAKRMYDAREQNGILRRSRCFCLRKA